MIIKRNCWREGLKNRKSKRKTGIDNAAFNDNYRRIWTKAPDQSSGESGPNEQTNQASQQHCLSTCLRVCDFQQLQKQQQSRAASSLISCNECEKN